MDEQLRRRAETIICSAQALPERDRAGYVNRECGGDETLRTFTEQLLRQSHGRAGPEQAARAHAEFGGADPYLGRRIGPYEIKDRIGSGGFGAVYRAVRRDDYKQYVAIKLLKRGSDTEAILKRFDQERKFLAGLQHDHIARFITAGETEDGLPYVVMEYVEGSPLDKYCDENRVDIAGRLRLFQQVCSAVQFAHGKFVLHRDIKPGNILITKDGVPKLLDFGISKSIEPGVWGTMVTLAHEHVLTPDYASPEQVRGGATDTRSDIYSLGVVLYELLTGHKPYYLTDASRRAMAEMQKVVCESVPKPPSEIVSMSVTQEIADPESGTMRTRQISPDDVARTRGGDVRMLRKRLVGDLDHIALYALRKEPGRRYASAQQMSDDIQAFLDGEPLPVARPESRTYVLRKTIRRHRGAVTAVAAVVVALVAGMGGTAWQSKKAKQLAAAESAARDRAETIMAFVTRALQSSDPGVGGDLGMSAAEAMRSALKELNAGAYDLDEETEARLRNTIAKIMEGNGRLDEAEPLFRQVLEMRRRALGNEHEDVASTMINLALLLTKKGELAEAEELIQDALGIQEGLFGDADARVLKTKHNLAGVLYKRRELGRAKELFEEVIAGRQALRGEEQRGVVDSLHGLAALLQDMNDLDGAERRYREALAAAGLWDQGRNLDAARTMSNLGTLLRAGKRLDEAEGMLEGSYAIRRELLGESDPDTALSLSNLSRIRVDMGRFEEAERGYRGALAVLERESDSIHAARSGLGRSLAGLGRYAEAEQMLRKAFDGFSAQQPPSARYVGSVAGALADLYRAWDQAEPGLGHAASAQEWQAKAEGYRAPAQPVAATPPQ